MPSCNQEMLWIDLIWSDLCRIYIHLSCWRGEIQINGMELDLIWLDLIWLDLIWLDRTWSVRNVYLCRWRGDVLIMVWSSLIGRPSDTLRSKVLSLIVAPVLLLWLWSGAIWSDIFSSETICSATIWSDLYEKVVFPADGVKYEYYNAPHWRTSRNI